MFCVFVMQSLNIVLATKWLVAKHVKLVLPATPTPMVMQLMQPNLKVEVFFQRQFSRVRKTNDQDSSATVGEMQIKLKFKKNF